MLVDTKENGMKPLDIVVKYRQILSFRKHTLLGVVHGIL